MLNDTTASLLHGIFGHSQRWAKAHMDNSELKYAPQKTAITEQLIGSHIDGSETVGAYQLSDDNTVNWLCWDIDGTDRSAVRKATEQLLVLLEGLPISVEFSGRKGYHIWIFLNDPSPAREAKKLVDTVVRYSGLPKTGNPHVEAFPKQSKLTKGGWGNLVKIPLGKHPATNEWSRFVSPDTGWEHGPPIKPAPLLEQRCSLEQIRAHIESLSVDVRLTGLLTPYWDEGSRHDMALYVSGYLASHDWPLEKTLALVETICQRTNDDELGNRLTCVRDTYRRIEEGESTAGFTGLADRLPQHVLALVQELVSNNSLRGIIAHIDRIRLKEAAVFHRVRQATDTIINYLKESGELLRSSDYETKDLYWLSSSSKLLFPLRSEQWSAICHNLFGLNPKEGFSVQVLAAITLEYYEQARIVQTSRLSHWDGDHLYVNLGGRTTYRLNGEVIEELDNGDDGIVFVSSADTVPDIDLEDRLDVWDALVNDISFSPNNMTGATPEQQRELLKAWILGVMFPQLLPTKPILMSLGAPGSGKTTAARRVLKLFEGPSQDVLELLTDKQDAFRTSIMHHKVLVLDNLEKTTTPWIVDSLNRLATGTVIEMRELYSTNKLFRFRPEIYVIGTSVQMPFSEESLLSRILPMELEQISQPKPEALLQQQLNDNWPRYWADFLHKLNEVVALLKKSIRIAPHLQSSTRMADFSVFTQRIKDASFIDGEVLAQGVGNLTRRQQMILKDASPFVTALEIWIRQKYQGSNSDNGTRAARQSTYSVTELFTELQPIARQHKLTWGWRDPRALAHHVRVLEPQLKTAFGVQPTVINGEQRYKLSWNEDM